MAQECLAQSLLLVVVVILDQHRVGDVLAGADLPQLVAQAGGREPSVRRRAAAGSTRRWSTPAAAAAASRSSVPTAVDRARSRRAGPAGRPAPDRSSSGPPVLWAACRRSAGAWGRDRRQRQSVQQPRRRRPGCQGARRRLGRPHLLSGARRSRNTSASRPRPVSALHPLAQDRLPLVHRVGPAIVPCSRRHRGASQTPQAPG